MTDNKEEVRDSCVGCEEEGMYCYETCPTYKIERERIKKMLKDKNV